jgi:hypothetical protein
MAAKLIYSLFDLQKEQITVLVMFKKEITPDVFKQIFAEIGYFYSNYHDN